MSDSQTKKSLHPLIAIAAVSVTILSLVGVAAMTGLLPGSKGEVKPDAATTSLAAVASADVKDDAKSEAQAAASKTTTTKTQASHSASVRSANAQADDVIAAEKTAKPICNSCGVVESVRSIEQKAEKGSGVGAVAGAVLGGVLGHQVGGGNGRKQK